MDKHIYNDYDNYGHRCYKDLVDPYYNMLIINIYLNQI